MRSEPHLTIYYGYKPKNNSTLRKEENTSELYS